MTPALKTATLRVSVLTACTVGMFALIWWGGFWYIVGLSAMAICKDSGQWAKRAVEALDAPEETDDGE